MDNHSFAFCKAIGFARYLKRKVTRNRIDKEGVNNMSSFCVIFLLLGVIAGVLLRLYDKVHAGITHIAYGLLAICVIAISLFLTQTVSTWVESANSVICWAVACTTGWWMINRLHFSGHAH